jgi:hypothetical protein
VRYHFLDVFNSFRGGAIAGAVLGPLDAGVVVIVSEIPEIVRADP